MYRDVIAWRKEVRADTMLQWYKEPEVMQHYFPTGFHGFDTEGYPVMVERQGSLYVTTRCLCWSYVYGGLTVPCARVSKPPLAGVLLVCYDVVV